MGMDYLIDSAWLGKNYAIKKMKKIMIVFELITSPKIYRTALKPSPSIFF